MDLGQVAKRLLRNRTLDGECWIWTGALDTHGYGHVKIDGRLRLVHRLAYEIWIGEAELVHHACERRTCFNPTHLLAVTRREHVRLHRWPDGRCSRSHDITLPENLKARKNGTVVCRLCANQRDREYLARKRTR